MHTCRVEYPAPRAPAPLGRFALPSSPSRSTMISGLRKRRNRLCATECAREARRTFRCSVAKAIRKLLRLMRGPEINKEVSPVNRRDHKDRGEPADLSVSAAGKDTQAPNTSRIWRPVGCFFCCFVFILFVFGTSGHPFVPFDIRATLCKGEKSLGSPPLGVSGGPGPVLCLAQGANPHARRVASRRSFVACWLARPGRHAPGPLPDRPLMHARGEPRSARHVGLRGRHLVSPDGLRASGWSPKSRRRRCCFCT